MINPGQLDRRVVIKTRSTTQDAAGQPADTWTTLATVWAHIKAPAGAAAAERVSADRETSTAAYSIRIRYRTDITAGMRAVHGSTTFDIVQVVVDMARREHCDLVCVAGAL